MEKNKKYWEEFYSKETAPLDCSNFAKFISSKFDNSSSILDVGCGNGRDTSYFEHLGYNIEGLDLAPVPSFLGQSFIQGDVTQTLPVKDIYYCRFFLHALDEITLDKFLTNIVKTSPGSILVAETRSTKGVTDEAKSETFFKSPIGKEHFRMLYSLEYLFNKLSSNFYVSYIEECNTFSPYKNESPYLIRTICHA